MIMAGVFLCTLLVALSSSLDYTMESSPESSSDCPVVSAWAKSSSILARLKDKNVLILQKGGHSTKSSKLTRFTCVANHELLVPLINLVGH